MDRPPNNYLTTALSWTVSRPIITVLSEQKIQQQQQQQHRIECCCSATAAAAKVAAGHPSPVWHCGGCSGLYLGVNGGGRRRRCGGGGHSSRRHHLVVDLCFGCGDRRLERKLTLVGGSLSLFAQLGQATKPTPTHLKLHLNYVFNSIDCLLSANN